MEILNRIEPQSLIAIDTCIWIYHLEAHPEFAEAARQVLTAVEGGHCRGVISELTLMELVTGPLQQDRQDIADEYELLLTHFPNLTLVPVSREILLDAARIRAVRGLRTPDAIILATALRQQANVVITNDQRWSDFPPLRVIHIQALR